MFIILRQTYALIKKNSVCFQSYFLNKRAISIHNDFFLLDCVRV